MMCIPPAPYMLLDALVILQYEGTPIYSDCWLLLLPWLTNYHIARLGSTRGIFHQKYFHCVASFFIFNFYFLSFPLPAILRAKRSNKSMCLIRNQITYHIHIQLFFWLHFFIKPWAYNNVAVCFLLY